MQSKHFHSLDKNATNLFPTLRCIGVSHQMASAEVREALSFSQSEIESTLRSARRDARIERLVILSTCHRTELYADIASRREMSAGPGHDVDTDWRLKAWLAANRGVPRELIDANCYALDGVAVVNHLFRLACGLESVISGEPQIISQVACALARSVSAHTASPALKHIFKSAVRAAEQAQAAVWGRLRRADLGTAAAGAASQFLEQRGTTCDRARVAIFGAGELGELALSALIAAGARNVTLVNRTHRRAATLAERNDVCARPFDELANVLGDTDVAIFALAGSKAVVSAELVGDLMRSRQDRPLAIIDVGMPRNVDVRTRSIPGVWLAGIDELGNFPGDSAYGRAAAVPMVEEIVRARAASCLQRPSPASRETLGATT